MSKLYALSSIFAALMNCPNQCLNPQHHQIHSTMSIEVLDSSDDGLSPHSRNSAPRSRSHSNASTHSDTLADHSSSAATDSIQTTTCKIDDEAYVKIIAHLFKYPDRPVVGLLLGNNNSSVPAVLDAVPLFHSHSYALASTVELALQQVDIYAQANGLSIVGLYASSASMPMPSSRVLEAQWILPLATKLLDLNKKAISMIVDNAKLVSAITQKPLTPTGALVALTYSNKRWNAVNGNGVHVDANAITKARKMLLTRDNKYGVEMFHQLSDFDDHLDDVSEDWTNTQFLSSIR